MRYIYVVCVCFYVYMCTTWNFFSLSFRPIANLVAFPQILIFVSLPPFGGWSDNLARKKGAFEGSHGLASKCLHDKQSFFSFLIIFCEMYVLIIYHGMSTPELKGLIQPFYHLSEWCCGLTVQLSKFSGHPWGPTGSFSQMEARAGVTEDLAGMLRQLGPSSSPYSLRVSILCVVTPGGLYMWFL